MGRNPRSRTVLLADAFSNSRGCPLTKEFTVVLIHIAPYFVDNTVEPVLNTKARYKRRGALDTSGSFVNQPSWHRIKRSVVKVPKFLPSKHCNFHLYSPVTCIKWYLS